MSSRNSPTFDAADSANIAETIERISQKPEQIASNNGGSLFAVPEGYRLETDAGLAKLALNPARKSGTTRLRTVDSFIQYVSQHKQEYTQLYVAIDPTSAITPLTVSAVFNDHDFGALDTPAGWKDFRAIFAPMPSPEWKAWVASNKSKMSQIEFATFIEDNVADIAGPIDGGTVFPTGAEMLQMAIQFEASSNKRIKSAVRLTSGGHQLDYIDTDDDATVSRMQAFERFRLGLAPFWQGEAYSLEAKLRYRQADGKLSLWYELIRPDRVIDDAVKGLVAKIEEELEITPLYGATE